MKDFPPKQENNKEIDLAWLFHITPKEAVLEFCVLLVNFKILQYITVKIILIFTANFAEFYCRVQLAENCHKNLQQYFTAMYQNHAHFLC